MRQHTYRGSTDCKLSNPNLFRWNEGSKHNFAWASVDTIDVFSFSSRFSVDWGPQSFRSMISYRCHFIENRQSLFTVPIHFVYRILDDLRRKDVFLSAYNVCSRLNSIIDSYHPYQVKRKCFWQYTVSFSSMYPSNQKNIVIISFLPSLMSK